MCVCPCVRPLRFVCPPGTNNLFVPRGTNIFYTHRRGGQTFLNHRGGGTNIFALRGGQTFFVGGGGGHDDVDEEMDVS